jgi:predicted DNA-binding transcriptional regulator AlpA
MEERTVEDLLTTEQVAAWAQMSKSWFEHRRWLGDGTGPKWKKIGRNVRYRRADVQAWLDKQTTG